MTKSKKPRKQSTSSPSVPKIIEIDEGVFGPRLMERGEIPINLDQVIDLVSKMSQIQALLIEAENEEEDEEDLFLEDSFDEEELELELQEILGTSNIEVNEENLNQYLKFLKARIKPPYKLTGNGEFDWEEEYVSGGKSKKEYEKLKKQQPSYTDTFSLVQFCDVGTEGIMVKVERTSDRRQFILPLIDLDVTPEDPEHFELIDNYLLWFFSY
ncbi:hypothetical protein [Laspinema olomoucense]|uniref:Uncharacterized protein n=1 Tax=Laspinema olomoucense D3b TaxID=2953688 RepID=A0ABT2N2U9_9CYAN|nr:MULTISPECIES: hypothetical protein [unclassified Laspinema]MCT7977017.1 hypothetical protein [Laspinema sp. D3b]MCT7987433.1 hypothetical protein [Laspinema sp. D3a]